MKKKELLTVKELAAELRMSVKSIHQAYREAIFLCSGCIVWHGSISPKSNGPWSAMDEVGCSASIPRQLCRARSPAKAGGAPCRSPPIR